MNGYTVAAVYGTITGAAIVGCLLNKPHAYMPTLLLGYAAMQSMPVPLHELSTSCRTAALLTLPRSTG